MSETQTEQAYRRQCQCADCEQTRQALSLLDDIATSDASMGWADIEALCSARALLAHIIGATYDMETERYV